MALDEQILKVPGIAGTVWFQALNIEVQLQHCKAKLPPSLHSASLALLGTPLAGMSWV